jgi:signal transduction histidine kinase
LTQAPTGPAPAADNDAAADLFRALYLQAPASLAGNGIGLLLMVIIFVPLAPGPKIGSWAAAAAVLWLLRLAHWLRFRAQPRAPAALLLAWRSSWVALSLTQGALWGLAAWLFWGLGTAYHQVALILIVVSYCLGSVQLMATQRGVFLAFITLALAPTILRIASDTAQEWHLQLAFILTLLFLVTVLMARAYGNALDETIALKRCTDELAARLRHEMILSDEARCAAEAANRARTQFVAAASHDLRQPLYAMGLFAEALRQRVRDPEVATLVNNIIDSVDALENLFSELLDITRIDTGGVDVKPEPVHMQDLFARLRLDLEPMALDKGLMLRFRGGQHVALTDPVLLERLMRNLVSNAIRYTDDGGVLVSARQRQAGPAGTRLLLQVWDSGIGIAETKLPRIFDEFFQAQEARPLQAPQRMGQGLGLAIVKRLAALMQAPIAVRSRVGRGTVFLLELPLGGAANQADAAPAAGGDRGAAEAESGPRAAPISPRLATQIKPGDSCPPRG